jgi:hypothetical protein
MIEDDSGWVLTTPKFAQELPNTQEGTCSFLRKFAHMRNCTKFGVYVSLRSNLLCSHHIYNLSLNNHINTLLQ